MSNLVIDTFIKGGPIMWPILATSLAALTVIAERTRWWILFHLRSDKRARAGVYTALENGRVGQAAALAAGSSDPVLRVISHGLEHRDAEFKVALQNAAAAELERAGRFLNVLDVIITLAPLLGLLGTVTGIMRAFQFVGDAEVAAINVSGGIAEALIATAAGLAIAMLTLLPFSYFNSRLARLTFHLQTAANNIEIALGAIRVREITEAPVAATAAGDNQPETAAPAAASAAIHHELGHATAA